MKNSNRASPGSTERLEIYLDGGEAPAEVLTEGPFHVDLDTTVLPNGEHTMRVVRVDASGNASERTVQFTVHNEPEPEITGLEPGATVAGRVGIDFAPPAPPPLPKRVGISPWWYLVGSAVIFLGVYLFFVLVPAYNILAPSGAETAAASAPAVPVDQALMTVGQKVFTDDCAACHQAAGTGMPPSIPALAGNTVLEDVDTVLTTIWKGAGAMQPFDSLDAQQVAGVATYVRNSWGNAYGGVAIDTVTKVTGAGPAPTAAAQPSAPAAAQPSAPAPAQPSAAAPAQPSAPAPAEPSAPAPAEPSAAAPAQPSAAAPAQPSAPTPAQPSPPTPAEPSAAAPAQPSAPAPAEPSAPAAAAPSAPAPAQPTAAAPAQPSAAAPAEPGAAAKPAAAASAEYVKTPSGFAAADGTELGTLSIGAKLASVGQDGDKKKVTVNGWSMQGAESVVFLAMGTRVPLAMLTDAGQKAVTVVQQKEDDYGTSWKQVTVTGLVDPKALVGDADSVWTDAANLYASSCSACHALHSPDTYTANQWPGTLKSMVPNTALTPDQVDLITKYLQYHAKGM